jgi:hypothetical protein
VALLPVTGIAAAAAHASTGAEHPQTAAATDYVSTTGDDSGPCSKTDPCQTINVAIGKAPVGGVISVAAGTYHQTVDVTKPVTLSGASPSNTTINGAGLDSTDSDYGTVHVGDVAGLVVVKGFTITNPYPDSYTGGEPEAVALNDPETSGEIAIVGNKITEGSADTNAGTDFPIGIDTFANAARTEFSKNTISGFFQGALVEDNGPISVTSNTFSNEISNSDGETTYPAEGLFFLSDLAGSQAHQDATSNTFSGYAGYGVAVEGGYDGGNCTGNPCSGSISGAVNSNSFSLGGAQGADAIVLDAEFTNDSLTYTVNSNTGTVASPTNGIEVDAGNGGTTQVIENNNNIQQTGSSAGNAPSTRSVHGQPRLHTPNQPGTTTK